MDLKTAVRPVGRPVKRLLVEQGYYRARRRRKVDPRLALFASYWYRGYSCNPRAVYEKASELVPGFRGVWVVHAERAHTLPGDVPYVTSGSLAYYDLMARARVLVTNANLPNHFVKRAGTVYLMTHHGTPLKHMGMDLKGKPIEEGEADYDALLRRVANWDLSLSSNRFSTGIWERVYPGAYESVEYGYPRNDALAVADPDRIAGARRDLGLRDGQRAVLFAPTHRDDEDGYVPRLDAGKLLTGLGDDWVVLMRQHYFYEADGMSRLHERGRVVDVSAHPSIEDLCLAADVLLTDYSSVMFDYALLDRPIVLHTPDWDEYRRRRGVYFDLEAEPPGVVARTEEEVVAALRDGTADGASARHARAAFRERFCGIDDGHAAERVVRRLWPEAR